ncbi:hypothetical protein CPB86DRAFT_756901 [Serendipita vermifera]|nr:hypothetical protein CPB86DRAFT_756901 [Serendipita vermifera]
MVDKGLEIVYFALQLFSIVTLSILTWTLLFGLKQPGASKPNPLLAANTSSYVLSGIISSLLLFSNRLHGSEPPRALCEAQSALMLAFPPLLGGLALSLVLTVWRLAWLVHNERTLGISDTKFNILLIAFPYVTFLSFVLSGALVGARSNVQRKTFYCLTDNRPMTTASAVTSAIFLFTTCVFQLWTLYIVYRRYRISKKFGRDQIGTDVPLFVRVFAFGIFVFAALILSILAALNWTLVVPDIIVACSGPIVFFVFASQPEVLRAWKLKAPLPRTDRSDSVATLNSSRPPASRPRHSNTFSFINHPVGVSDLHTYRFPADPPPPD